jgi:hypothetical protein
MRLRRGSPGCGMSMFYGAVCVYGNTSRHRSKQQTDGTQLLIQSAIRMDGLSNAWVEQCYPPDSGRDVGVRLGHGQRALFLRRQHFLLVFGQGLVEGFGGPEQRDDADQVRRGDDDRGDGESGNAEDAVHCSGEHA